MSDYNYEIEPRAAAAGGGWRLNWRLKLLRDGEEVGGGAYPATAYAQYADEHASAADCAHADAQGDGEAWVEARRDDLRGIDWWNGCTEAERRRWMRVAGDTGRAVDAWNAFKAATAEADASADQVQPLPPPRG